MIPFSEIMSVMDIVSTKRTNAITINVSMISDSKKVRYKLIAIFCSFISDHITIDNYYYLLSLCKT